MLMKKQIVLLAGLALSAGTYAQTEVLAGTMHGKDYGVTYMLPKTEIEIKTTEISATRIIGTSSKTGVEIKIETNPTKIGIETLKIETTIKIASSSRANKTNG